MTTEIESRKKLVEAIEAYVKDASGDPGMVATDFVLDIAAVSMNGSVQAHYYHALGRGGMHAQMGLNVMRSEALKALNHEEANADD